MFEGMTLLDILRLGGSTMVVLILCSILSITIFLERILYYRKQSKISRNDLLINLSEAIKGKDTEKARRIAN